MEITFTKCEDNFYTAAVLREDGVLLQVRGSDRKFPLPHDIAHYVVEQGLGLRRGFWGRVARGAVFPGMKILQGRQPVHAAERSRTLIREEPQQGTEAEVLVGTLLKIMHGGLDTDLWAARILLEQEWHPTRPERAAPTDTEIRCISSALREAERHWQSLEVGHSATYHWSLNRVGRR